MLYRDIVGHCHGFIYVIWFIVLGSAKHVQKHSAQKSCGDSSVSFIIKVVLILFATVMSWLPHVTVLTLPLLNVHLSDGVSQWLDALYYLHIHCYTRYCTQLCHLSSPIELNKEKWPAAQETSQNVHSCKIDYPTEIQDLI